MSGFASHLNYTLRVKAYEAKQLDQYVIEGKLGEGGMGEVYRAQHALMQRPTAVKVLRPDVTGSRALQRFEKEVRRTCRLTHPNTIRIYDYGRTPEGDFYYAMELLDGADLERLIAMTGPLSPARVVHVLAQTCAALHEAHEAGLVHRDVKPSNILLCIRGLEYDVVKVMDFGLVKDTATGDATLTRADEICGSPLTISPEALTGADVTRRSALSAATC
jgi:serine/threonine-protein kinase